MAGVHNGLGGGSGKTKIWSASVTREEIHGEEKYGNSDMARVTVWNEVGSLGGVVTTWGANWTWTCGHVQCAERDEMWAQCQKKRRRKARP